MGPLLRDTANFGLGFLTKTFRDFYDFESRPTCLTLQETDGPTAKDQSDFTTFELFRDLEGF
jgi:hypothetical protein